MLCDFGNNEQDANSFGNQAEIIESRTKNRIRPIHYGVDYNESPLEFTLVAGSLKPMDRADMQMVAFWLTGHQQYQWLTIEQPDMDGIMYRCLVTQITPIHVGWLPYAFEITFRCDSPYAYSDIFSYNYTITGSGETTVSFNNVSTVREYLKPKFSFVSAGETLKIVNRSDNGRTFQLDGLSSGMRVSVDNENGIIVDETMGNNLYRGFNYNFFRLVPGKNDLRITGKGTLNVSGRYLYNVGA